MATDSTEDVLLQTFLDDVEKLSIHHDASYADERIGNEGKPDAIHSDQNDTCDCVWHPNLIVVGVEQAEKNPTSSAATDLSCRPSGEMRGTMIANANANRRAWSEFKKINISSGDCCAASRARRRRSPSGSRRAPRITGRKTRRIKPQAKNKNRRNNGMTISPMAGPYVSGARDGH